MAQPDNILEFSESLRARNYKDITKLKCVGQGSFGSVFQCKDNVSSSEFALKKIQIMDSTNDKDIVQEVLVLASLEPHDRLVKFYGSKRKNNSLLIYLEFLPKGSLQKHLEVNGALSEAEISHFTFQILEGIQYLHRVHIIHRDIKPANILLGDNNNLKLTDFGLSKLVQDISKLDVQTLVGTIKYMAPELLNSLECNKTIDIWSLGVTVIEMITGQPIYSSLSAPQFLLKMVNSKFKIEFPNSISPELYYFLSLVLITRADRRPNAADVLRTKFIMNYNP